MSISLHLDDEQSRRLVDIARTLNVDPSELAKAAINDLVSRPSDEFDRAARHFLEKNRELVSPAELNAIADFGGGFG